MSSYDLSPARCAADANPARCNCRGASKAGKRVWEVGGAGRVALTALCQDMVGIAETGSGELSAGVRARAW